MATLFRETQREIIEIVFVLSYTGCFTEMSQISPVFGLNFQIFPTMTEKYGQLEPPEVGFEGFFGGERLMRCTL